MTLTWNEVGWRGTLGSSSTAEQKRCYQYVILRKDPLKMGIIHALCVCSFFVPIWAANLPMNTASCTSCMFTISLHAVAVAKKNRDTCRNNLKQLANYFVGLRLSVMRMIAKLLVENITTILDWVQLVDTPFINRLCEYECELRVSECPLRCTVVGKQSYLIMSLRWSVVWTSCSTSCVRISKSHEQFSRYG